MAVKPDNIMTFFAPGYGTVQLVKRSVSYRYHHGPWHNRFKGVIEVDQFYYWRGQLVHRWQGKRPETGEAWGPFYRGQIVWLRADLFKQISND